MRDFVPIPSPGVPLEFGEAGAPLVVIVPDRYGRLPWLEPYAAAMADRGAFRVLVLDLYGGYATTDDGDADLLEAGLADEAADAILEAAIERGLDEGATKVGVVGFGSGGAIALRAARRGDADAVVAYYPDLASDAPGIVPCPVLLHLAEQDAPVGFASRLRDDGTPVASHTYTDTRAPFANATLVERVDGRAAALAFARTVVFLESRLT